MLWSAFALILTGAALAWLIVRSAPAAVAVGIDPAAKLVATWTFAGIALAAGLWISHVDEKQFLIGLPIAVMGPFFFIIDVLTHRLPNGATLVCFLLTVAGLIPAVVFLHWFVVIRALLAALLAGCVLLLAWAAGQLGLGDVKLAVSLALFLGAISWQALALGTILSFLSAGIVAVILLLRRRAGWRSRLALGPWLIVGTLVTAFVVG